MTSLKSYYELFGVSSSVDAVTLRKAFTKLSKALHPDTTSLPPDEASCRFQQVCEAYEILSDPNLRKDYDESIHAAELARGARPSKVVPYVNCIGKARPTDVRRPLSGGEWLSLLLLGVALLFGLILGVGFSLAHGREWQVIPTWLIN